VLSKMSTVFDILRQQSTDWIAYMETRYMLCMINVDSGTDEFVTTLWLSQKTSVGPSIGIPNIRSL
jgi:hypothetical protein